MKQKTLLLPLLLALPVLAGCDKPQAFGETNSIIVAAADPVWDGLQEAVMATLEPRVMTVRDERTLKLTRVSPHSPDWRRLRSFRQVLLIGTEEDEWIQTALAEVRGRPELDPPMILQAFNVWAQSQLATILLLPPRGGVIEAREVLDELQALMDRQYREWSVARMYVSGRDTTLLGYLEREGGFSLDLPRVYRWAEADSVFRFRNDNPSPAELIREIIVTWTTPANVMPLDSATVLSWREAVAEEYYVDDQQLELRNSEFSPATFPGGYEGFEVRASWASPPGAWPAAGPFLTRALHCPGQDRVYLLDAWLYAPGLDKYQYMIQLETILDSFRCGAEARQAAG